MSHDDEVKDYGTINVNGNLNELSAYIAVNDDHKSLSTVVRYCGAAVCITLIVLSCELIFIQLSHIVPCMYFSCMLTL